MGTVPLRFFFVANLPNPLIIQPEVYLMPKKHLSLVFSSLWLIDEKTTLAALVCGQSFAPLFLQRAKGNPCTY